MKDRSVRLVLPFLLLAGCTSLGQQLRHITGGAQARLADQVVIERDEWGVAHIRGGSDAAVAFGAAWAMAEDDYRGVEEGYIRALGRSAYYYGVRYLADDLVRSAYQVESLSRAEYAMEPESVKRLLLGFAHGLNYYLRRQADPQARVITRYEPWMILARVRWAAAEQWVGGIRLGDVAGLLGELEAGGRSAARAGPGVAWAVASARSVTGRALLLATAEAPFFGSEVPYELELWSETGWHVHGFAELGVPVPYIGRNERLAWGAAPAARDSGTVQRLVFGHPTDSVAYRAGAGWERASSWLDTVHVNTPAGVEARTYRFLGTHDGPVISRRGDTAFVVHLPGGGVGGTLQRRLAMSRARSLAEFKAVLEARGRPGGAVAYADVDGNILVDRGDGSGTLLNPASGEVRASASGREWPAGDSALTAAGLARLALGVPPAVPSAEIEQLVHEWEQVGGRNSGRAFAMDTAIEMLRLWDRRGAGTAAASEAGRAGAVAGGAALDSAVAAGATLYHVWREAYRAGAATDGPPEADAGIHVADPAGSFVRFRSLEEAVARLRREWGTVRVPWTEMARLQRPVVSGEAQFRDDAPSTPVTGLPDGSPFVLSTVPGPTRRRYANAGTAAVMVTEFVTPPRTWSIAVFGQSADTGSSHYFDQAARYAAGELKDAQFGGGPVRERYQPGRRARVLHGETPIR